MANFRIYFEPMDIECRDLKFLKQLILNHPPQPDVAKILTLKHGEVIPNA